MKVLGVKVTSVCVRYAILSKDSQGNILFCNSEDNRLVFPRDADSETKKMKWLWDRFDRLLSLETAIQRIVIKLPEAGRIESGASRLAHYLDAVIMLVAEKRNAPIPVIGKMYRSLHTRSADVLDYVQNKGIPRTEHYWDVAMGDAIAAALAGLE